MLKRRAQVAVEVELPLVGAAAGRGGQALGLLVGDVGAADRSRARSAAGRRSVVRAGGCCRRRAAWASGCGRGRRGRGRGRRRLARARRAAGAGRGVPARGAPVGRRRGAAGPARRATAVPAAQPGRLRDGDAGGTHRKTTTPNGSLASSSGPSLLSGVRARSRGGRHTPAGPGLKSFLRSARSFHQAHCHHESSCLRSAVCLTRDAKPAINAAMKRPVLALVRIVALWLRWRRRAGCLPRRARRSRRPEPCR